MDALPWVDATVRSAVSHDHHVIAVADGHTPSDRSKCVGISADHNPKAKYAPGRMQEFVCVTLASARVWSAIVIVE
jgi:hypothetical protein